MHCLQNKKLGASKLPTSIQICIKQIVEEYIENFFS